MKKLMKTFKYISIVILALAFSGCEDDDVVVPKVQAGFTYTLNMDTGTVTFINISEKADTYSWDFGDDKSSTLVNPVKTYASGTYTIILEASHVSGSSDTFQDEITILIPETATIPITFDGENTKYEPDTFEGASFEVVDNPAPGGTNNVASKVGAITNSGATFEGIVFELGTAVNFATDRTIKMNFWADAAVDVLLKFEEGSSSTPDVIVSHGGTGWEELSFNFTTTSTFSKLVLFVDGPGTTAGTFYIDDIIQTETPAPPCTPETEQSLAVADFNVTFLAEDTTSTITDDGSVMTRILNPDTDNDINKSCYVGQIVRSPDAEFANNQIEFDTKLDFNANAGFKLKVWSATAGTNIQLKIEDKLLGNSGPSAVVDKVTTVANAWEELTFDFASGDSDKFDRIVLFFEVAKNVPGTYYIDDFMLYASGTGGGDCVADAAQTINAAALDLTFASDPGTIANKLDDVNKFFQDDVIYEYVDNPDASTSANNSCKVGKVTKQNVNTWDNLQLDFADKLTFEDGDNFTIKVFSPQSGYKVTFKLEDKTNGDAINSGDRESTTSTTKTNEWEELTIPFGAGDSGKYDKIVIFFDLATKSTNTYYFDDLKLNRGTGGGGGGDYNLTLPIDFETSGFGANWSWNVFENDNNPPLEFVDNPFKTGINNSDKVAKITAQQTGGQFVGTETVHGSTGMGINWDLSTSNAIIKIMVYKTVISDVGIKLVNPTGGAQGEIRVANTIINAWEELTFDFSDRIGNGLDGSTNIDQIVVFPELTAGRASDNIVYFDNITFNEYQVPTEEDASLSDLKVDGNTVAGFNRNTLNYSVSLAEGTTTVPTITVTENQGGASSVITPAGSLPGETTIVVTAEDGITKSTYTVAFTVQTSGGGGGTYNLTLPIDFESSGFGANWSWNVFENVSNPPLEFVANPNASGINTSATVAKITALQAGAPWVGTETVHGQMGINWDLSASNAIIKIMVYKTVISDVGIKLVNPTGGAQGEIKVANTKINEWEELTFDFSSRIGNGLDGSTNIDQIVVFPDHNARASDTVTYFDNITFNSN